MATGASAFTRLQSDGRLVANAVKKVWVALVIVLVVAVAAFCVTRLRTFFGYHDNRPIAGGISDDIKPFNPKHVVYQVFGAPGTVADINYLDINATPQRVSTTCRCPGRLRSLRLFPR
jgi:Mycobacterium membrane protein